MYMNIYEYGYIYKYTNEEIWTYIDTHICRPTEYV